MGDIVDTLVLVGTASPLAEAAPVLGSFALALFLFDRGLFGNETFHRHETRDRQRPRFDRRPHGTRWLFFVFAVAESAVFGEREDVGKRAFDSVTARPQRDGPQTRRVDEPAPRWQRNELGCNRGVSAALVALAHLARALDVAADERVDKGRLTDTACTEQRDRSRKIRAEVGKRRGVAGTDRVNGKVRGDPMNDRSFVCNLFGGHRIGFGEQHHRTCATVEGEDEFAFKAPRVDAARRRLQQEDDVDVRRNDVGNRPGTFERCPAHEGRSPRCNRFDSLFACVDGHVVTDGDVGADVADAGLVAIAVDERTPPTIETPDTPREWGNCAHSHER